MVTEMLRKVSFHPAIRSLRKVRGIPPGIPGWYEGYPSWYTRVVYIPRWCICPYIPGVVYTRWCICTYTLGGVYTRVYIAQYTLLGTPYLHTVSGVLPGTPSPLCGVYGEGVLGSNLEISVGMRRIEASLLPKV